MPESIAGSMPSIPPRLATDVVTGPFGVNLGNEWPRRIFLTVALMPGLRSLLFYGLADRLGWMGALIGIAGQIYACA
jgi:hypothetical protein